MALSPAAGRYHSAGEIRREIGKLLFTGRYAPSTFNLAYFVNALFGSEIDEESRERASEAAIDPSKLREALGAPAVEGEHFRRVPSLPGTRAPAAPPPPQKGSSRGPALVVAAVFAAAVGGALWVLSRRPEPATAVTSLTPTALPTPPPQPTPEPSAPTVSMSEEQFKGEVERRLTQELRKLEDEVRRSSRRASRLAGGPVAAPAPTAALPITPVDESEGFAESTASITEPPALPSARPTETPVPARRAAQEGDLVPLEEADLPPKVARVVKPAYPPIALKQRIGGIVVLRVLVTETGNPSQVEVVRGVKGGITESAVAAVRRWTFEPARKDGVAVKTWTTVPIPFEP
jgi:protein TonB